MEKVIQIGEEAEQALKAGHLTPREAKERLERILAASAHATFDGAAKAERKQLDSLMVTIDRLTAESGKIA